jgi:hypothetical protein
MKRSIEVITKKDDVLILEDYRKIDELEQSLANLNKTSDTISGQSFHLNVEFLQQQCKELVEGASAMRVNQKKEDIGATTFSSPASRPNNTTT